MSQPKNRITIYRAINDLSSLYYTHVMANDVGEVLPRRFGWPAAEWLRQARAWWCQLLDSLAARGWPAERLDQLQEDSNGLDPAARPRLTAAEERLYRQLKQWILTLEVYEVRNRLFIDYCDSRKEVIIAEEVKKWTPAAVFLGPVGGCVLGGYNCYQRVIFCAPHTVLVKGGLVQIWAKVTLDTLLTEPPKLVCQQECSQVAQIGWFKQANQVEIIWMNQNAQFESTDDQGG